jgi:hypothetical protein
MKEWQLYRGLNPALSLADLTRRWRGIAARLRKARGPWREVWRLAEARYSRVCIYSSRYPR